MSKEVTIPEKYDFSGWATKNNLLCSDGRIIRENAFAHNDGRTVPLVWNHRHDDPNNVLGHAFLKNEKEGVKTYGIFNDTPSGQTAKALVDNGDITMLSIFANQLQQHADNDGISVLHGEIREVSLVLAGANPGAHIDSAIVHGDFSDEAAVIRTGENLEIFHAEEESEGEETKTEEDKAENQNAEKKEPTVAEVLDSMTEDQKKATAYLVTQALNDEGADDEDGSDDDNENSEGGNKVMKHNVFDNETAKRSNVLSHDAMKTIFEDAKRGGSLRTAFNDYMEANSLAHDGEGEEPVVTTPAGLPNEDGTYATYGMSNIDYLFPEHRALLGGAPSFVKRDTGWVTKVMNGIHHSPFAKIKSIFADITGEDARARGYTKGGLKKDEVIALLRRKTGPTTVYKKQKFDRDDLIDITEIDTVAWIKAEMRIMLDEEIARACLFGDGRSNASEDKIDENCIRPVITDDNFYAIKQTVGSVGDTDIEIATKMVDDAVSSQDTYQGSGRITAFISQPWVTKMLLLKDEIGHRMYKNLSELATAMSVDEIVKVPAAVIPAGYYGVMLDLNDYNVGADKGGNVNLFDDFDIDYNQYKYLIETRCSGALVKPYSAIVLKVAA